MKIIPTLQGEQKERRTLPKPAESLEASSAISSISQKRYRQNTSSSDGNSADCFLEFIMKLHGSITS